MAFETTHEGKFVVTNKGDLTMKPLPWIGSKFTNAKSIISRFPDHDVYIEPFFGGGSIFFSKIRSKCEIINDINDLLVNFFTVIKNDVEGFLKKFEWALHSRTVFEQYRSMKIRDIQDPAEKAFVFYYLVRNSWCHLYRTDKEGNFNAPFGIPINLAERREDFTRNISRQFFDSTTWIKSVHDRLKGVTIENLDYKKIIKTYDSKRSFFFLDPPYNTDFQYSSIDSFDHAELKRVLSTIKGKFLMTLDISLEDLFKDYKIEYLQFRHFAERSNFVKNILVRNYEESAKRYGMQIKVI